MTTSRAFSTRRVARRTCGPSESTAARPAARSISRRRFSSQEASSPPASSAVLLTKCSSGSPKAMKVARRRMELRPVPGCASSTTWPLVSVSERCTRQICESASGKSVSASGFFERAFRSVRKSRTASFTACRLSTSA